jgi:hypothetical protein
MATGRRAARVVAGLGILAAAFLPFGAPAAGADPAPLVTAPAAAFPGATITVDGFGFEANGQVSVAVCGDGGLDGSSGCDLSGQIALIASSSGLFAAEIKVSVPPDPCPCAVVVETVGGDIKRPIVIIGAPTSTASPVASAAPSTSESLHTRIAGGESWKSWFGLPNTRSLTVTVVNKGTVASLPAPITVSVVGTPGGTVDAAAATVPSLQPGQSTTLHLAVPIAALTIGTVTTHTQVLAFNDTLTSGAQTFEIPWALLALGAVVVQLVLLRLRDRFRRRINRGSPAEGAPSTSSDHQPVIDLTEPAAAPSA